MTAELEQSTNTYTEWSKSPERQARRVVVTGIGMVTPLGNDVPTSWSRLISSQSGIVPVTMTQLVENDGYLGEVDTKMGAKVAGILNININDELNKYGLLSTQDQYKNIRKNHRSATVLLIATAEALQMAALLTPEGKINDIVDKRRFGVRVGTLGGGTPHFVNVQKNIESGLKHKRPGPNDVFYADPARLPSEVSLAFGLKGPNEAAISACASGSTAIIGGYQDIYCGDADIMIVGGVDSPVHPILMSMFDQIRALSHRGDKTASRPFDETRDGFVMAEGAGVMILETEQHALRRGVTILAELAGYGKAADAEHDTEPTGYAARETFKAALRRAGIPKEGIIYQNAHGTGTPKGDRTEVEAYLQAAEELEMDRNLLAVSSTKSATGHMLGATGAVEANFTVLALTTNIVPPTINNERPIELVRDILVRNDAQILNVEVGLNGNFGFGGAGTEIAFRKYIPQ